MGHISKRLHLALWGCLRLVLGMKKRCTSSFCTKMWRIASSKAASGVVCMSVRTTMAAVEIKKKVRGLLHAWRCLLGSRPASLGIDVFQ